MEAAGATVHVLTSLDDIAWLLNMRGNDVRYNPVALAYAMVWRDRMLLFINCLLYTSSCSDGES